MQRLGAFLAELGLVVKADHESQRVAAVTPDLVAALAGNGPAIAAFEHLRQPDRYAVILPLLKARTPETAPKILARGDRPAGDPIRD